MRHRFLTLKMLRHTLAFIILAVGLAARGADPTDTTYSFEQCDGSAMPYQAPTAPGDAAAFTAVMLPDSLTAIFIDHVGRHGARYPSSPKNANELLETLLEAQNQGCLTPKGAQMLALTKEVISLSHNRWGALDSLGMAEQRGIASRMLRANGHLFDGTRISAISSYAPRCVMSMDEFTHQLCRLNNNIEVYASSGRQNSPLMRFFDLDADFQSFLKDGPWRQPFDMQLSTAMPAPPARALFTGEYAKALDNQGAQEVTYKMFKLLQGLQAMGLPSRMADFFTPAQANAAWSCTNLRHYLQRTATVLSAEPADIAGPLLAELLQTLDEAAEGKNPYSVMLRFGHAETLMPLLSLMRLDGCYYLTNYYDTVALHWRDFDIVPMAANLQLQLCRSRATGTLYLRTLLNEHPVPLIPGDSRTIIPWTAARNYLQRLTFVI